MNQEELKKFINSDKFKEFISKKVVWTRNSFDEFISADCSELSTHILCNCYDSVNKNKEYIINCLAPLIKHYFDTE